MKIPTPPKSRAPRSRNSSLQFKTIFKHLNELLEMNRQQVQELTALKGEIEHLRRDLSFTLETLAEHPYVSGMVH